MKKRYIVIGCLLGAAAIQTAIEGPAYPGLQQSSQVKEAKGWNARQPKVKYTANEYVLSSGRHMACETYIKAHMTNPSSYRRETPRFEQRRTGVIVYSGTNAFGGRVRETYKCA